MPNPIQGKQSYNALEELKPHSEKFIELMNMEPQPDSEDYVHSDEEIEQLAKEDLITLTDLFPDEADYYMYSLSD